jgi:hypothetical protein
MALRLKKKKNPHRPHKSGRCAWRKQERTPLIFQLKQEREWERDRREGEREDGGFLVTTMAMLFWAYAPHNPLFLTVRARN